MKKTFDDWLLVSDMDATLLTSDHRISDENKNAIEYFIENGGKFTVASGRMVEAIRAYLPHIPINAPAIIHNGAKIYDFDNEKILFEKNIEDHRKQQIKAFHDKYADAGMEIYCDEKVYIYRECSETARFKETHYDVVYDVPKNVHNKPWIKVLIIGDRDKLDEYEDIYRQNYDNQNAFRSGDKYLDIVAEGVSKGVGVDFISQMYGIDKRHTVVIGDNMNDVSMLEYAGVSYAVENAEESVKSIADYIAPHHDNNAICYVVKELEKHINKKSIKR